MELRIKNYVIAPDNGRTWSLQKIQINKETGLEYKTAATFPKDLTQCLLRIREDIRREDIFLYDNIPAFIEHLKNLDDAFIGAVEKAVKDIKFEKPLALTEDLWSTE